MEKISKFIVKYRNKILLIAVLLLIPSIIGYMNTNINYDILLMQSFDSYSKGSIGISRYPAYLW